MKLLMFLVAALSIQQGKTDFFAGENVDSTPIEVSTDKVPVRAEASVENHDADQVPVMQCKIIQGVEEIEKRLGYEIEALSSVQGSMIADLKAESVAVKKELAAVQAELLVAKEEREQLQALRLGVAFSAYLSHHVSGSANEIVFDRVVLNAGGAYNPNTGVFTVPINGVYQFSFFVMATPYAGLNLKLTVDDKLVSSVYVDVMRDSHQKDGGNVVIVKAEKDQKVRIVRRSGSGGMHSWEHTRTSSFSGFLIYVD